MNRNQILVRWKLNYGNFEQTGPWNQHGPEYEDKASSFSRNGLKYAAIEIASDCEDDPLEIITVDPSDYVEFRWIALTSLFQVEHRPEIIGLALITKDSKTEVFKKGTMNNYMKGEFEWLLIK